MAAERAMIHPILPSETRGREGFYPELDRVPVAVAYQEPRDRVRWGPIIAGFFTAMTMLLVLNLLGLAIGLTTLNTSAIASQPTPPAEVGTMSMAWAAISAFLSFLVGGFVAGRAGAVFNRGIGALNGMLVFVVAVPVTLWLAGQGAGAIVGGLAGFLGELNVAVRVPPPSTIDQTEVIRIMQAIRNGAWGVLIALGFGLLAASIGGALGTRTRAQVERTTLGYGPD
jgi:hypothetical protein